MNFIKTNVRSLLTIGCTITLTNEPHGAYGEGVLTVVFPCSPLPEIYFDFYTGDGEMEAHLLLDGGEDDLETAVAALETFEVPFVTVPVTDDAPTSYMLCQKDGR